MSAACLLQVIGCEEGFLNLMDENGGCREDLKCPPKDSDLGKEVEQKLKADEPFMVSSRGKKWKLDQQYIQTLYSPSFTTRKAVSIQT